jgi:hypothetical protein
VRRVQDQCSSHAGKSEYTQPPARTRHGTSADPAPRHVQMLDPTESQCCDSAPRRRRLRPDGIPGSSEQGAARGVHRPGAGAAVSSSIENPRPPSCRPSGAARRAQSLRNAPVR